MAFFCPCVDHFKPMLDLLRTPARSKRGALGIKHPCVECVLEVAFPAVNVVNAENILNMLSWVGGMVNSFLKASMLWFLECFGRH